MQTEREKANAVDMHTTFQQELVKLRLATAKAYMKVMTDGQVSLPHSICACVLLLGHERERKKDCTSFWQSIRPIT